ncbi:short-chain dehydrogenase/reductase SDR [Candidatus Magnetoovum chiemensis]|nr:short-chain dehydrogenase/reductase SDR [Candidatus Magnetoovum chiemensis]
MEIRDKLIVITGASSGIGRQCAELFAKERAKVILLARRKDLLEEAALTIAQSGGFADYFKADVTDYKDVESIAVKIINKYGVPDVIFNNAGAGTWRFLDESSYDEITASIAAPYLGAAYMTRAFLPDMLKRNSGLIINMSSFVAYLAFSGCTAYSTARWAMRGFHEALKADLYSFKVRAMLVAFAKVDSSFWQNNLGSEERLPKAQKYIPVITAQEAASYILNGIKRDKTEVIEPFMSKIVLAMKYLFPSITRLVMYKTGFSR